MRPCATLAIIALTPVRMLADCVRASSILPYQHLAFEAVEAHCGVYPYGCLLNGDFLDTVGCTPPIYQ
jgi:hypothetical protein